MPKVNIEYDDSVIAEQEIQRLAAEVQKIVAQETKIEDVFVYANSANIKVNIAPVEIFIEMSASKIEDRNSLIQSIKAEIISWKETADFNHLINLTLIPMEWDIEIGI